MIPAGLYYILFLYTIVILTVNVCTTNSVKGYQQLKAGQTNIIPIAIFCLLLAVWIGGRPIDSIYFCDTSNYADGYKLMQLGYAPTEGEGDWLWDKLMFECSKVMNVSSFFTLVSIGYFGFMLYGCYKLMPNQTWIGILFCMGAFSFFTYATNGIRNGLACSIVIAALALANRSIIQKVFACILAYGAYNIHHSTALPLLMAVVSIYIIKSFRVAYVFWILSIIISIIAGGYVTSIFAGLGFDDRLSYLDSEMDAKFSHTGFRLDFLIYSMMPIVLGYYIIYKRGIRNATYEFLLNTYTLANAFWVMVIRANYSNRFAYLSWFMYPIVLAYPLVMLNIWGDNQGKRASQIMLAHIGFTWFLQTIY